MTNDEAFAAIRMVTKEEPLKMRPACAALKALEANGWRPDLVKEAIEALDGLAAARRNDDGFTGDDLYWERERASKYAFDDLEDIEACADHEGGAHAEKRIDWCVACQRYEG